MQHYMYPFYYYSHRKISGINNPRMGYDSNSPQLFGLVLQRQY